MSGENIGRAGIVAFDTGEHLLAALILEVADRITDQPPTYTDLARD